MTCLNIILSKRVAPFCLMATIFLLIKSCFVLRLQAKQKQYEELLSDVEDLQRRIKRQKDRVSFFLVYMDDILGTFVVGSYRTNYSDHSKAQKLNLH